MTKFLRELAKREVFWKTHTSAKSFLSETFLPRIANVLREWPKVASRLRSDEVYFDHFWPKCQIVDEAIRAKKAEEKELPARLGMARTRAERMGVNTGMPQIHPLKYPTFQTRNKS